MYSINNERRIAICAILLSGAVIPSAAWGQAENLSTDDDFKPAGAVRTAQAGQAASGNEIVVTARRREELLRDVPAVVNVVSGDELRQTGVTNTAELAASVPGVTFTNFGVFPSPAIRGISSQAVSTGAENAVAVYIDGVYIPNQLGALFDLPDVSQVEVLKGPQGTLYGRNATAGAILISSEQPGNDFRLRARASYGRFDDFEANGFVAMPIVADKLAISISGGYHSRDGFVRDIANNRDLGKLETHTVRGKLRFTPTSSLSFTLTAYLSERYDESTFAASIENGNTVAKRVDPTVQVPTRPYTTAQNHLSYVDSKAAGVSGKLEWGIGVGTLTSITAFSDTDSFVAADSDLTNVPVQAINIDTFSEAWTEDVFFISDRFGPVEFTLGYSYYNADNSSEPLEVVGVRSIYGSVGRRTHAGYGEVTAHLTDRLSAALGVRYTHEDTSLSGRFGGGRGDLPLLDKSSFSNTSISAVLQYELPDVGNFYASYREGFKSGDYSVSRLDPNPTNPELIEAYELGFKSSNFRGLSFSLAGYYYDYTDLIATLSTPTGTIFTNAPKARVVGGDLEINWRPLPNLAFAASANYTDTKYTKYSGAIANVPVPASTCAAAGTTYPCGNGVAVLDLTGAELMRAPEFTGSLSGTYTHPVGNGELIAFAKIYHNSGFWWEVGNRVGENGYTLADARLTYRPDAGGPFSISVWGRNLFDEAYGVSGNITSNIDGITYGLPRTFGLTLEVDM